MILYTIRKAEVRGLNALYLNDTGPRAWTFIPVTHTDFSIPGVLTSLHLLGHRLNGCIRSTPTERQSTRSNDFECFARSGVDTQWTMLQRLGVRSLEPQVYLR